MKSLYPSTIPAILLAILSIPAWSSGPRTRVVCQFGETEISAIVRSNWPHIETIESGEFPKSCIPRAVFQRWTTSSERTRLRLNPYCRIDLSPVPSAADLATRGEILIQDAVLTTLTETIEGRCSISAL